MDEEETGQDAAHGAAPQPQPQQAAQASSAGMVLIYHPHTGDVKEIAEAQLTPWMVKGYVQDRRNG